MYFWVVFIAILAGWSYFMSKEMGPGFVLIAFALCGVVLLVITLIRAIKKKGLGELVFGGTISIAFLLFALKGITSNVKESNAEAGTSTRTAPADGVWDNARR